MVRKLNPKALVLCVPVSPWDSLMSVEKYFEKAYVLHVQERSPFAVASFYQHFKDLSDREVRTILAKHNKSWK